MSGGMVFSNNRGMGLTSLVVGGGVGALVIMTIMKILNSATVQTTRMERYDAIQEVRETLYNNLLLSEDAWLYSVNDITNSSMECLRDGSINCCEGGPPNANPSLECNPPDGTAIRPTEGLINVYHSNGDFYYDAKDLTAGFTPEGQVCNSASPGGGYSNSGNPNCPWRAEVKWRASCTPPACRGPDQYVVVEFLYSDGRDAGGGAAAELAQAKRWTTKLGFTLLRQKQRSSATMAFAQSQVFDTPHPITPVVAPHVFNVPYGVEYVMVEAWGAGGGGASGAPVDLPTATITFSTGTAPEPTINIQPSNYLDLGGGGGGGGAYMKAVVPVVPGAPIAVYVGQGGAGGAADGSTNGGDGGYSGFNIEYQAIAPTDRIAFATDSVFAYGGQGGVACDSATDLSTICDQIDGSGKQDGLGGVSGFEGLGGAEPRPVNIDGHYYILGKNGGKYNSIFNQYFQYHQYSHPPTSLNPTAPINRMVLQFFGGQGGDAGGSGGYGGSVGIGGVVSLPSHPGGGGAGSKNGSVGQSGANGRVIVWW